MARELTVALVGATGVVGAEFLRCMEEREFPVGELRLLATKRSEGRQLEFRGEMLTVRETSHDAFDGADIAFISASTAASKELCPVAAERGARAGRGCGRHLERLVHHPYRPDSRLPGQRTERRRQPEGHAQVRGLVGQAADHYHPAAAGADADVPHGPLQRIPRRRPQRDGEAAP